MKVVRGFISVLFVVSSYIMPTFSYAQVRMLISVSDADTGVPIENVNVINKSTGTKQISDKDGNCRIIASAKDSLYFSHVSFRDTMVVVSSANRKIHVNLSSVLLNAIEVYAGEGFNKKAAQGVNRVSLPFLTAVPTFLGEPDVIKGLTFLPGVSTGKEGYSHLFVRGGEQDQNQILLDGATMFNVNHFGGYISMFQPELVGGIDFYKNYWPSKFGGRLSSVLDIRTKEGNYKEHHQSFQVGLIAPKLNVNGPLVKDRVSYNVGIRRTIVDVLTGPIARKLKNGQRTGDVGNLVTQDITMRLDGRLGNNHHISISGLYGRDKYAFVENDPAYQQFADDNYSINNKLIAFNYGGSIGLKTAFAVHASYSNYTHFYDDYAKGNDSPYYSGIAKNSVEVYGFSDNRVRSIKFNVSGSTKINEWLGVNYGAEQERLDFGINVGRKQVVDGSITNDYANRLAMSNVLNRAIFTDVAFSVNDNFRVNTGLRLLDYTVDKSMSILVEPKVLMTYAINEKSTVNMAFNLQRQNTMLLGFTDNMGRFREYYISNDGRTKAAASTQWSLGYFRNALGIIDNISVEVFHKNQSNAVKYVPSIDFYKDLVEYNDFLHRDGKTKAYGLELLMQKTTGKVHSSLAYTYAKTQSMFASLNEGNWFNADFDFRHNINFLTMYSFGSGYKLAGSWTYKTGRPFTLPTSSANIEEWGSRFNIVTAINNRRMPAFHRLDISMERRWKTKKNNTQWFNIGIYNVYNRVNPFFAQPADTPGQLEVTGMFPIMPFFNIGFEF